MKIIFSHGKESGPWGTKINALAELVRARGLDLDSIDYQDLPNDPEARVERLASIAEAETQPVVLVGSSMGGYVSAVVSCRIPVAGLFLDFCECVQLHAHRQRCQQPVFVFSGHLHNTLETVPLLPNPTIAFGL